jgi:hypothetical protein
MSRAAKYTSAIVVAHLLVNIVHGVAHRKLRVGLSTWDSIFVIGVVLILPLFAIGVVWAVEKRVGLMLLSVSMFAALLFGLYHHFLVISPDHVHSQPAIVWGMAFTVSAYGLLITEAIGTYIGVYFLCSAKENSNKAVIAIR